LVIAALSARLGIGRIVEATVRMAGRVGGASPGRKVLTLVHAMVAGASLCVPRMSSIACELDFDG
jgi:hypothetical protein